jgi:nucleotide-binding universal stress UspA family protein
MTLKNILLHMDATDRCEERLHLAGDLAQRNDAHLSGLFVIREPFYPVYADGAYFPQDMIDNWEKDEKEDAEKAEKTFQEFVEAEGIHGEWRSEQGPLGQVVSRHARYADLTIVGKGGMDDPKHYPDPFLAEDVVMESGRPVLVVPNAGHFAGFGKRVLVCWNASREAVRAINDAMPLLQLADKVTVLVVNPEKPSSGDHGDIPSADIALYLARHGVKAEATSVKSNQSDVGGIILSRAFDADADMIVAGAYGHSRTREWILGGVTKTLLHETTVPAFMSH